jgi:hypothetical protein
MSRTVVNFFLDFTLLVVFLALGATAAILQFAFPPGTEADGWLIWGFTFNAWSRVQFGLISLLALGILVHVMLHWTWICGVVVGKLLRQKEKLAELDDGIRTLYGVTTLIVAFTVVGAVVAAAILSVQPPAFSP